MVLPSVPVIPTTPRSRDGSPDHQPAASASAGLACHDHDLREARPPRPAVRRGPPPPRPPPRAPRSRGRPRGTRARRRTAIPGRTCRESSATPVTRDAGDVADVRRRAARRATSRTRPAAPRRSSSPPSGPGLPRRRCLDQPLDGRGLRGSPRPAPPPQRAGQPRGRPPDRIADQARRPAPAPPPAPPTRPRTTACARTGRTSARRAPAAARAPATSTPPRSISVRPSARASWIARQRRRCIVPGWSRRRSATVAGVRRGQPAPVPVQDEAAQHWARPRRPRAPRGRRGGRRPARAATRRRTRPGPARPEAAPVAGGPQQVVEAAQGRVRAAPGTRTNPSSPGRPHVAAQRPRPPSRSARRIRWRVALATPSSTPASSPSAGSASAIRWRDGWISGDAVEARTVERRPVRRHRRPRPPGPRRARPRPRLARCRAVATSACPDGRARPVAGPGRPRPDRARGARTRNRRRPAATAARATSARTSPATRNRGRHPPDSRCAAHARDWKTWPPGRIDRRRVPAASSAPTELPDGRASRVAPGVAPPAAARPTRVPCSRRPAAAQPVPQALDADPGALGHLRRSAARTRPAPGPTRPT